MLETIRRNKFNIILVASIVAIFLLLPSLANAIEDFKNYNKYLRDGATYYRELRNTTLISIIEFLCLIIADVFLLVMGRKRSIDKTLIMFAIILYYASDSIDPIYDFIKNDDYSSIYSVIINVIIASFAIIALSNDRYLFASLVLLLIDAAFALVSSFGGSAVGLSKLILILVLMISIYFSSKSNELTDEYYQ